MKRILYTLLFISQCIVAQQSYYDDVNLSLTGQALYLELQEKINIASASYTYEDAKDGLLFTDIDPENSNDVLLIYGYQNDNNCITDRTRDRNEFGGNTCEYNREHVFARSNANPGMGSTSSSTTGIGADPHNLRSSDVQRNGNRGNRQFEDGTGNGGVTGSGGWYPGDEWKGDVARMMMYMYTRYGDRCLPSLNANGALQSGTQMLQMYLQWNVEDPVSEVEMQRNPYTEQVYGNRNPFIDQPLLATIIWGGPEAEDLWATMDVAEFEPELITTYPNPVSTSLYFETNTILPKSYKLYNLNGIIVKEGSLNNASINLSSVPTGIYILELKDENKSIIKKVIKK